MTMYKRLIGVMSTALMLAGCGTVPQATSPAVQTPEAALAADAAALGPDTAAPEATYSVQQAGYGMRTNDRRISLGMDQGDGRDMRMRFDRDDVRLRRLHPRVSYIFNRYPNFFHNIYGPGIYTLRPTITIFTLRRLFPDLDDATLLLLLERLYLFQGYNVYDTRFVPYFRPFVVHRPRHPFPHHW